MQYYTEPSREIPVAAETEVLVVVIGPADRMAAALKSCAKRHATVKRSRSSIRKNCVF